MSAKDTALLADSLPLPQVPRMAQSLEPRRIGAALRAAGYGDWVDLIDIAILLEDRDTQWRTVLQSRKLAVVRLPIIVEAAADDVRAQKDANLIRTVMAAPGVRRLIYDLMDGIAKGFAVVEVSWSSGSTWLPAKYVYRDQRHFRSRPEDPEALLWRPASANRLAVSAEEPLAPPRMITHRPMLASVPAPQAGLARLGAWLWCFKSFGVQDWLEFLEGFGQPLRVGKYPNSASKDDIAVLRRAVLELGRVAGVTIPAGMELSFEDATGKAADDLHLKAVTYFDQQASKLILGQTTTTDAVSGGHAVSREHNQVRGDIRDADADDLAETLMRDLVQPIIDMNHGPPPDGRYPRLRIAEPDRADIAVMADALDKLVPLGLQVEGSVVADVLGLPDPPPGVAPERLLRPAAPAPALPPRAAQSMLSLFDQAGDRDGIDDLAADALADWRPLMAPMIDGVRGVLDRAATLEEVRDRLAEAIQGMDSDKMADMLARAGFFARAAGELDILPADPGAA